MLHLIKHLYITAAVYLDQAANLYRVMKQNLKGHRLFRKRNKCSLQIQLNIDTNFTFKSVIYITTQSVSNLDEADFTFQVHSSNCPSSEISSIKSAVVFENSFVLLAAV